MSFYEMGGHGRLRVRETYLRDQVAPLLNGNAAGVVKVDLALRSLASRDDAPGLVSPKITYDAIHDLCRPESFYGQATKLKRQWVSEKLERLVALGLLDRTIVPGKRPRLIVLRDDGTGRPFDDPGESADSYASFFGDAFEFERVAHWGSPELAAFFAAMIAERYARADPKMHWLQETRSTGDGVWFRPLDWFEDSAGRRPSEHVRIPFSVRTLRRGLTSLRRQGLISSLRTQIDPRTGSPLRTRYGRVLYFNGFGDMRSRTPMTPDVNWANQLPSNADINGVDWAAAMFGEHERSDLP